MNDTMSLLLATTILALGGLGLYMYKSSEDDTTNGNEKYDEDSIFGSTNFWGFTENKEHDELDDNHTEEEYDEEEYKPKKRQGKTQKNRKAMGSSKRRY
jgi:hypothetical protein